MKRKLISFLLAAVMICAFSVTALATAFTDVPANHWAAADIKALAEGGLLNGMGDGTFAPDAQLTIAQLAKIICTAKGLGDNAEGYWAKDYIAICLNDIRCLPDFGTITPANYDVACTRELAAYMIVNGLGLKNGLKDNKQLTDIPDWKQIDDAYSQAVVKAYNAKLLTGMDEKGTFAPKGTLIRAQAAAILHRAGFTTAAEKPAKEVTVGDAKTGKEIFDTVKAWSDVKWEERTLGKTSGNQSHKLIATNAKYGGVEFFYKDSTTGALEITMPEQYFEAWEDDDIYKRFNESTVVTVPSGFCYDARQLVKRALKEAFPTGADEAYAALISVMKQEIYEIPNQYGATALRWIDGRCLDIRMGSNSHTISVGIGTIGYDAGYKAELAEKHVEHGLPYQSQFGGPWDLTTMYELNRG